MILFPLLWLPLKAHAFEHCQLGLFKSTPFILLCVCKSPSTFFTPVQISFKIIPRCLGASYPLCDEVKDIEMKAKYTA